MSDVNNPYTAPRAAVADIGDAWNGEFQTMTIWGWRGRIGRLRFLAYGMVSYFVFLLVSIVVGAFLGGVGAASGAEGFSGAIDIVVWVLLIPYLVFSATVTIRRSHDMGWSGWMSLLAFIPLVGLIWVFKAGSPGANDYGAPPPPNTLGVKLAAFGLFGVLFLGGILAAIAIPAYQGYVERARAVQPGK